MTRTKQLFQTPRSTYTIKHCGFYSSISLLSSPGLVTFEIHSFVLVPKYIAILINVFFMLETHMLDYVVLACESL